MYLQVDFSFFRIKDKEGANSIERYIYMILYRYYTQFRESISLNEATSTFTRSSTINHCRRHKKGTRHVLLCSNQPTNQPTFPKSAPSLRGVVFQVTHRGYPTYLNVRVYDWDGCGTFLRVARNKTAGGHLYSMYSSTFDRCGPARGQGDARGANDN